ncbi:amidohydrolase [Trinickia violacea]|uniref:Amidohydrolase n=1 Tax=Trinickia violacea TaxID=2571746 RepID=A0A4P8IPY5_9BURK|nr:amidohydrolase family protein [Trinickia violacea]QCP50356.1 amidohydrolase [Trinickia violacea]
MVQAHEIVVNPENEWRLKSTPPANWQKGVRREDSKKYFMISCDTHLNPPVTLFRDRLDAKWHDLLPRVEKRENGERYVVMPGARPERLIDFQFEGEDLLRSRAGGDTMSAPGSGAVGLQRIADQEMDGVEGEVIFPNGPALFMWSSTDTDFVSAQCAVWNDWAWEICGPYVDRCSPAAAICTADIEGAVREVQRVAKKGFRLLTLPCKPIWGAHDVSHINYNLPVFDPLWAAIQDADLTITYHVATGKDPRAARGNGGAIINYVVHALAPTIEPIVSMCSSGVFERFPKLRVATIEADAGWVPWMMHKMDEAYRKHHFWVRPKLKQLPSEYYRSNCFASFGEDDTAMRLVEPLGLEDNFMWANDYPHHEGSWPHSAEAIERTFGEGLKETTRAKLLGLNAAKAFRFPIPERYRD